MITLQLATQQILLVVAGLRRTPIVDGSRVESRDESGQRRAATLEISVVREVFDLVKENLTGATTEEVQQLVWIALCCILLTFE